MKKPLLLVDLFCGAGGMSLGFSKAGFKPVFAADFDSSSVQTYRQNLGEHCHEEDVCNIDAKYIEKKAGVKKEDISLIIGGPPCQGFSVQRRGENNDPRNQLVGEFVRVVCEIMPRFFVMENVSGLLSTRGKQVVETSLKKLNDVGYHSHIKKISANRFGVPQMRKRVFLVGELTDSAISRYEFPEGQEPDSALTVRNFIEDLKEKSELDIANHKADKLSKINIERISSLKPGDGRDKLPEHLQLNCHKKNNGHRHLDVYGRMPWDGLAPTITARFDSFSRGRFGHPEKNRTVTLREGARLQTFPDSFEFKGSKVEVARQIGNAVPPKLAEAIAESIKTTLYSNGTLAQRNSRHG